MSDLKMSDVFDLPVSVDKLNLNDGYIGGTGGMTIANFDCEFVSTLSHEMATNAAHAINNHDRLVEQIAQLEADKAELVEALTDISNMCIGEIAMGYRLDAQSIVGSIYKATGLTNPELNELLQKHKG